MHPKHNFFSKNIILQWAILIDLSQKTFSTHPPPKKIETTCFYTILHKHIKPYV
jgi:hypothetical protein